MIFSNGRYFSKDNYELIVLKRVEKTKNGNFSPRIYGYTGFSRPAYYRIKQNSRKNEIVVIKGHEFEA